MTNPIVSVRSLVLRRGARQILSGATFDIRRGEVVVLMGQSGSGKTSILRTVAALEAFDDGSIEVEDVRMMPGPTPSGVVRQLRRKIGMVFQFHCLFEHLTAMRNVTLAPVLAHGRQPADAERHARDLLAALGVEHRCNALPRELSGGEAQRVAIARALAVDPPVVLMDEPTASLDPARRTELSRLIQDLVSRDRTLIVTTHDEEFAESVATRILLVNAGVVEPRVG